MEFFKTKFTGVPECFVNDGIPFHGTKSDILKSILPTSCNGDPSISTNDQDGESFDVYIVDLSVQIRAKASVRDSLDKEMTYSQFCLSILNGACNFAKSVGAKRLDLVADMYRIDSIKGPTRKKRGTCSGIRFDAGDILPRKSKLDQYRKNDDFKVDINRLIVDVASDDLDTDLEFAITDGLKVLKVNEGVQIREVWSTIDDLMEEADNRVLLYIRDAIGCGHNRILLKIVDSDIIIILLGFIEKLLECNSEIKMWVKFNSGVNEKLIDMNTTFKELGGEIASGIMFSTVFLAVILRLLSSRRARTCFSNHGNVVHKERP